MARTRQDKGYKRAKDAFLKTVKHECHYCGVKTISRPNKVNSTTIDHIKPQSTHPELKRNPSNFVVSCGSCNRFKGTIPYETFMTMIKTNRAA